jgi:hypothetical protein
MVAAGRGRFKALIPRLDCRSITVRLRCDAADCSFQVQIGPLRYRITIV